MTHTTASQARAALLLTLMLAAGASLAQDASKAPEAAKPAAPNLTLDQLLEQVRTTDVRDSKVNREREARFAAARDQQAQLLAQAEAERAALEAQANELVKQFEANDTALTQLVQERDAKAGNLGEMFGVLRQAAGDFASAARNSLISTQFPGRIALIDRLAQTKIMPPMEDLQRFWYEMQREMTEGGKVTRFKARVVAPDGAETEQPVTRVGPFVAVSDGQFLEFGAGQSALSIPPKQPPGDFGDIAEDFEEAEPGYHPMVVDPTRGTLLSLYSLRPSILERIHQGEWVGYIILLVGAIGAMLAIYQFFYLFGVDAKVKRQLANLSRPTQDNPLGRVLLAFKGNNLPSATEDAEVVELRISEAVLRELPPITRIQSFLKLAVAAGPLLGLVGTVVGMIVTFQVITESGSGDPKLMAAGIGQAMIATVLGLGIAIPLLFMNSALQSRSKRIVQILDEQSTGLLAEMLENRRRA